MPDLSFLNSLAPALQIAFMLGMGLAAGYIWLKARTDQKKSPLVTTDPVADLRVRWDGPVSKHLEFLEQIAEGFSARREIYTRIEDNRMNLEEKLNRFEARLRECERAIDRLPSSDRHLG